MHLKPWASKLNSKQKRMTLKRFTNLEFIMRSSWLPRFKNTPPGKANIQDSSKRNTSRPFLPRSTKSPLNMYGFSGDGSPFYKYQDLRLNGDFVSSSASQVDSHGYCWHTRIAHMVHNPPRPFRVDLVKRHVDIL